MKFVLSGNAKKYEVADDNEELDRASDGIPWERARKAGELGSELSHFVEVSSRGNSSRLQRERNYARLHATVTRL